MHRGDSQLSDFMKIRGRERCASIVCVYEDGYGLTLVMRHCGPKSIIALFSVCFVTVVAGNVPEPPVVDSHFATHSLSVQPGCSHVGGHIVLRPHPPCDGRIGTTNLIVKYRPIVQDPHSWRPSIAFYSRLSLPTNRWFGTLEIPGGFTALSRVPSSRFEAVALTEGILFRKNLEPFWSMSSTRRLDSAISLK